MTIPYDELRKLSQDSSLIELFIVDCTVLGGTIYRFCNEAGLDGASVSLAGAVFYQLPIVMQGWGINSTGAPQKPTVTVSNISKELLSNVVNMGDIVGAKISRIKIFAKNLDGGSSPDSTRIIGPEIYLIDQKVSHTNKMITWNLSVPYDRPGTKLPIRQALKDPTSNSTGFPALSRRRIQ
ncbi:phage minor tail protein L [Variovorax sp. J22R193]|uniref:phage minor tail protein L n=1 Tax=Variovorax fucosicus TaxID=3053517 RepID=UPI002576B5BB|nr:phage minor tail protein L [Variovorax sp. J22R193]MDM0042150.1 phage minor tail protein L [Variovorax sp. J22R193]